MVADKRRRRLGLVARTLLATAFFGIVFTLVFVLLATAINDLQRTNDSARRAGDILAGANSLERTALALQTALDGYLITRDPGYLRAYDRSRREFADESARIGELITVPDQKRRLRGIDRAVRDFGERYAQPLIPRVRSGELGLDETRRVTRRAEALMGGIRRQFDVFLDEEEQILAARRARVDRHGDRAITLGLAGAAAMLVLLLVFAYIVERTVAQPIAGVARTATRLTTGDLAARVPKRGAAEVAELSARFNDMAAALEASERMKDEFFALVSHELRTPLTSIVGYTEVLRETLSEREDSKRMLDFVERIERGGRRLSRLVDDLLFVAEVEAGKLAISLRDQVDLAAVARLSADGLRHRTQNQGQTLELDLETVLVRADPDRLGQVVDNLLANAIKFTPQGGRVSVRVAPEDGFARLEVSDTGIGIPKAEQPRLFERFFRASTATRGEIQGVGLGLSIVKAVVEGHGGDISVASDEGAGTTFAIRLPVQATAGDAPVGTEGNVTTDEQPS